MSRMKITLIFSVGLITACLFIQATRTRTWLAESKETVEIDEIKNSLGCDVESDLNVCLNTISEIIAGKNMTSRQQRENLQRTIAIIKESLGCIDESDLDAFLDAASEIAGKNMTERQQQEEVEHNIPGKNSTGNGTPVKDSPPPSFHPSSANATSLQNAATLVTSARAPVDVLISMKNFNASSFTYYYLHIPKVGGFGAKRLLDADLKAAGKLAVCGQGLSNISQWSTWVRNSPDCVIRTSESVYSPAVKHTFTVVRPPLEHVLSQYFHCAESKSHKSRRHLMPSLDVWLKEWAKARSSNSTQLVQSFSCYNPINLQSARLCYPSNTTDLLERFDVIGVLPELVRSTCLMSIEMLGIVPPRCNCTNSRVHRRLRLDDHGVKHHGDTFNMTRKQRRLAELLTEQDAFLYEDALAVFKNHVRYVQQKYSFQMC